MTEVLPVVPWERMRRRAVEPVHAGHHDVEQDQFGSLDQGLIDCLPSVLGRVDLVSLEFEVDLHHRKDVGVVVNDQDSFAHSYPSFRAYHPALPIVEFGPQPSDCRRRILVREHCCAGHEYVGAGIPSHANGLGRDTAIDLNIGGEAVRLNPIPGLFHLGKYFGHEGLPAKTGIDRHHQDHRTELEKGRTASIGVGGETTRPNSRLAALALAAALVGSGIASMCIVTKSAPAVLRSSR